MERTQVCAPAPGGCGSVEPGEDLQKPRCHSGQTEDQTDDVLLREQNQSGGSLVLLSSSLTFLLQNGAVPRPHQSRSARNQGGCAVLERGAAWNSVFTLRGGGSMQDLDRSLNAQGTWRLVRASPSSRCRCSAAPKIPSQPQEILIPFHREAGMEASLKPTYREFQLYFVTSDFISC